MTKIVEQNCNQRDIGSKPQWANGIGEFPIIDIAHVDVNIQVLQDAEHTENEKIEKVELI